jgi:site-specific recombinase XerD
MKLTIVHNNFIDQLEADGKSESTVIAYDKDIEQLVESAKKQGVEEIEDLKSQNIENFMKNLLESGYTAKTVSRKTNAARTFIKYAYDEGIIKEDFSNAIKHPKFETKAPRFLSKVEYRALRDAARGDLRSFAMIEVLLQTGITISELSDIKMEHIKIEGEKGSLFVPELNNKEARTIPLNKAAVEAISEYIENDRPEAENSEGLFITKTGRNLLVRNIRSTIDRYFKKAGVENAKVNDIRHTFIAEHLKNGVSLVYLSKIAGHKRVSTTERYSQYVTIEDKSNKSELGVL